MKFGYYPKFAPAILIILLLGLAGCSSANKCPSNPSIGNAGSIINSSDDELLPISYNNKIYFTVVHRDSKNPRNNSENTYFAAIDTKGYFQIPRVDKVIPTNQISKAGSPTFYLDKENNRLEMYFAGASLKNHLDKDIYVAFYSKDGWTDPKPISDNINTDKYESHPFISQDGKYLIFASDRDGGSGETDLYISFRDVSGNWGTAKNLGNTINTAKREIAPFIAPDGTLFYSSDGFMENSGLDIIKAERINDESWGKPSMLNQPINSANDDLGPAMHNNKIFLSSNRPNGCGGYDIYSFELCKDAILTGNIKGTQAPNIKNQVTLFDELNNVIQSKEVAAGESYKFDLAPNKAYKVAFKSQCNPKDTYYEFKVPCSDSTQIHYTADFEANYDLLTFNLEDYQIPFFVSGYYRPNTTEHLENLKMKFLQNFFGNADSTRYIQNPGDEYNDYSNQVDIAMENAAHFIIERLINIQSGCVDPNAKILIEIRGYADQRPISNVAKYADETIDDNRLGFLVPRGAKMDNILLSKLRAYHTFKLLEAKLRENETYNQHLSKIKWKIIGEGEDTSSTNEDIKKRRVSVNITLK